MNCISEVEGEASIGRACLHEGCQAVLGQDGFSKSFCHPGPANYLDGCLSQQHIIAARALATYLIPGCVGRGVRLGSEGSSVGGGGGGVGGGVWKSGNLEIWKSRNFEICGPGNPEMWGPKNQRNKNSQNPNPFCPKCRQGLD